MPTRNTLEIVYAAIAELKPDPANPRQHSLRHIRQLAKSIQAFGFNVPVLVDAQNQLVTGHGRLEAAKVVGLTEIPTLSVAHLTPQQRRAYMIADNRMTDLSTWDEQMLGQILVELADAEIDFDIEAVGFSVGEIDLLVAGPADASATDEEPFPVGPAVSRPADCWELGKHRLVCGSALDGSSYVTLLGREKVDVVIGDPPYNVPIAGHVSGLGKVLHREFPEAVGEMSEAEFINWLERAFRLAAKYSRDGSLHYWAMDWRHLYELTVAARAVYTEQINLCVWAKHAGMGSLYRSQHELFAVWRKGKGRHRNNVELGRFGRSRTNLWTYSGPGGAGRKTDEGDLLALHPTVKPLALIADAILDSTKRGDIVLDPFLGSGTAVLAAEKVGRRCRGIELDPLYVDTAIRRWQRWTGERAQRTSDGALFDDLEDAAREAFGSSPGSSPVQISAP